MHKAYMWQEPEKKDINLKKCQVIYWSTAFCGCPVKLRLTAYDFSSVYFCTICVAEWNMFILTVLNSNLMCVPVMFAFV